MNADQGSDDTRQFSWSSPVLPKLPSPPATPRAAAVLSQGWPTLPFKSAFVTGGSGFIGRRLIRYLVSRKVKVKALARSSKAVKIVERFGAIAIAADLTEVEAMRDAMQSCDVAFHLAAKVDIWGEWEEFVKVNIEGARNVLLAAKGAGVQRVVYLSTEAVLIGTGPLVNVDERRPMKVENITGFYPKSKAIAEQVIVASSSKNLQTVVVRAGRVWGSDDTVFLKSVVEACNNGQFRWIGNGDTLTSTSHVENVCEGLVCGAVRGTPGQVYFVTDGEPLTFREFLEPLLQAKGVDITQIPVANKTLAWTGAWIAETAWSILPLKGAPPAVPFVLDLLSETITIDDSRARRELGYQGFVTFEDGVRELLDEENQRRQRSERKSSQAVPPLSPRAGFSSERRSPLPSPRGPAINPNRSLRTGPPPPSAEPFTVQPRTISPAGATSTRSRTNTQNNSAYPPPVMSLTSSGTSIRARSDTGSNAPRMSPSSVSPTSSPTNRKNSFRGDIPPPLVLKNDKPPAISGVSLTNDAQSSTPPGAPSSDWRASTVNNSDPLQEEELLLYMPKPTSHNPANSVSGGSVIGHHH